MLCYILWMSLNVCNLFLLEVVTAIVRVSQVEEKSACNVFSPYVAALSTGQEWTSKWKISWPLWGHDNTL